MQKHIMSFNIDGEISESIDVNIDQVIKITELFMSIKEENKSKLPIFRTDDGIDIYEGDSWFFISHNGNVIEMLGKGYDPNFITYRFSTKENAEKFVNSMLNTVLLTTNEVLTAYTSDSFKYTLKSMAVAKFIKINKGKNEKVDTSSNTCYNGQVTPIAKSKHPYKPGFTER